MRRGGQPRLATIQGRQPTAKPQLGPARKGWSPARAALAGTAGCDQLARLIASGSAAPARGCRPRPALLLVGAAAPAGKGSRRLRRGNDGDDAEGARGKLGFLW
ncbi:hypothetical protein GW17_00043305 [Ensete ventricosum]|nr:hypothetical protein GW17_00043305 [Ensete ventricosum]